MIKIAPPSHVIVKFSVALFLAFIGFSSRAHAYPEYAAYAGANCMACHVGPIGGFGRKPVSTNDVGYISDKFSLSGDFQFMGLFDQRDPGTDRVVMFPMEAAIHLDFSLKPTITMAGSMDFGNLREIYAMLHNEAQTAAANKFYRKIEWIQ